MTSYKPLYGLCIYILLFSNKIFSPEVRRYSFLLLDKVTSFGWQPRGSEEPSVRQYTCMLTHAVRLCTELYIYIYIYIYRKTGIELQACLKRDLTIQMQQTWQFAAWIGTVNEWFKSLPAYIAYLII